MKTALITPVPHLVGLADLPGDHYHLVLSHIALRSEEYARFYRSLPPEHFVILDNSAHERGRGDPTPDLIEAWSRVMADEIVLPDRLFFGGDTVQRSRQALDVLQGRLPAGCRYMVVPQGRRLEEWEVCLDQLLDLNPDTVGISKDYEVWDGGLPGLVELVQSRLETLDREVLIHLLGWGRKPLQVRQIARTLPKGIRGIDTAKPIIYAAHGILLPDPDDIPGWDSLSYPGRVDNFFLSRLPEGRQAILERNVRILKGLIAGDITPEE